tara:strand:- start:6900 stop:8396 length:1497 start_codon:yes stop_codon:yes gene_type:complete
MRLFIFYFLFFLIIFPPKVLPQSESDFLVHNISDGDTFHSLKLKYGVSKRKIIKWNPELKKCKFLSDCSHVTKILILKSKKNQFENVYIEDTIFIDSTDIENSEIINESIENAQDFLDTLLIDLNLNEDTIIFNPRDSIVNIAILLPFLSNTKDSIYSSGKKITPTHFLKKSRISLEFYSGLLFSFYEFLSDSTLTINLNVFDTHQSIDSIKNIIMNNNLDSMDIIFGPLYQKQFDYVSRKIQNPNTFLISPLQNNSIKIQYEENCKVYYFESNNNNKVSNLSKYIYDTYIKNKSYLDTVFVFLKKDDKKQKIINNYLKEWDNNIIYHEIGKSTISEQMSDEEINKITDVVFIPSDDPVFVSDIISRLHALKDSSLTVFCTDYITKFNLIPHKELFELNVHFLSEHEPFYENEKYINSFYNYFSINPQSKYVKQGYKCGTYFLNLFFKNINSSSEENILGTYFKFYLQKNNFFRNESFKLWRYNEYEIKEVIQFNESQ